MTEQRPIDVSELRDGDVVRAKRGEHGVVEGVWCTSDYFTWVISSDDGCALATGNDTGWTITDILRPVLVKGDRVEWVDVATAKQGTYVDFYGVRGLPGKRLSTVLHEGREILVATESLTRLPAAPEPEPDCPFPMGARVVGLYDTSVGNRQPRIRIVTGWSKHGLMGWGVDYQYEDGGRVAWDYASRLTLAPEPAPIAVGSWWADEDGIPHVAVSVRPGGGLFRRWMDEPSDLGAFGVDALLANWTLLDGPPEPPQGTVYVITNVDGQPDVWHHHVNGLHYCAGSSVGMPWTDAVSFYTNELRATLQIVHTLGVE